MSDSSKSDERRRLHHSRRKLPNPRQPSGSHRERPMHGNFQGENIYSLEFLLLFFQEKSKTKLSKRSFTCDVRGERITSIIAD